MPTDTLELDLYDLQATVGDFAGFGEGARFDDTAWTTDQQRRITVSVDDGCRSVYFTEEMEGIPAAYQWSFLQPRSELALPSGSDSIDLPADCNGLLGDIIPASSDGTAQFPIRVTSYDTIYRLRSQSPSVTGRPLMICEQVVKGTTADRGSRYKLQVYPTPDAAYTLQVWYEINPRPLTADFPHPYGGAPLAAVFKAACRAAYERHYDDTDGPENQEFLRKLRAAIAADRKHKPLWLGRNDDRSDDAYSGRPGLHGSQWGLPLEVNGVSYP